MLLHTLHTEQRIWMRALLAVFEAIRYKKKTLILSIALDVNERI